MRETEVVEWKYPLIKIEVLISCELRKASVTFGKPGYTVFADWK